MEQTLIIGKVVKPQGVRGELKIMPLTDDPKRFNKLKTVLIDETTYRVVRAKITADAVIVSILEITDRNAAEEFRGKFLRVKREDAIALEKGKYFIADLIGCELVAGKEKIGVISEIISLKTDVITVKTYSGKTMRFPFLERLNACVDVEKKTFSVDENKLKEISCYED